MRRAPSLGLWLPTLAAVGYGAARADEDWIESTGGAVQLLMEQGGLIRPIGPHPTIRMVSEVVRIKLPERIVHARVVFRNEGAPHWVLMGFPEEGIPFRISPTRSCIPGPPLTAGLCPRA